MEKKVKIYDDLLYEIERLKGFMEKRKNLTLGQEMWIQHIWGKTKQLNDYFEEKEYYDEKS